MNSEYNIYRLNNQHQRKGFDCGTEALNRYITQFVSQDERRNLAACYVLTDESQQVIGFYTLAASSIPMESLPEALQNKLPRYANIPTVHIGRLAIRLTHQKQRLGESLLANALKRALKMEAAVYALTVDAKSPNIAAFYERNGFVAFPSNPLSLYLPLAGLHP